jgi:DNA-directed RNA polymerase specialized sigma24 family protein
LESKRLLDEFLTQCDPVTRDMLYRRIQGFSWKEICKVHGISAHAAEARFSQAFQRVRKRLGLRD